MLNVPAPAVDGLNVFPEIPIPLNIPPAVTGVNVKLELLVQYGPPAIPEYVALGAVGLEIIMLDKEDKQPLPSLTTTG